MSEDKALLPKTHVLVRPLEWNRFRAETPFGYYHIDDQTDRSAKDLKGRPPFLLSGSRVDLARYDTLEAARSAAQEDFERRFLYALTPATQQKENVGLRFHTNVREALRIIMCQQKTTKSRNTYGDGFRQGLARAIEEIDKSENLAPQSRETVE